MGYRGLSFKNLKTVSLFVLSVLVVILFLKLPYFNKNTTQVSTVNYHDILSILPLILPANQIAADSIILINFWAPWCAPCIEEFPSLINITEQFPKLILIAISVDATSEEKEKFLAKFNIKSKKNNNVFFYDDVDSKISTQFAIEKLPETLIFDSNGKFKKKVIGSLNWSSAEAITFLKSL